MVAAVFAIGLLGALPAHAGGTTRSGTKGGKQIAVRFKNIRAQPVQVNAQSGSNASGGVALPQNGTTSVNVGQGTFTAIAKGFSNNITRFYRGSASGSTIYLHVEADADATTITVAPPF